MPIDSLPLLLAPGAWDVVSLFTNGQTLVKTIGGALLGLLGVVAVIVAVIQGFSKLLSEQNRNSWWKIIALLLLGGIMLTGGIALFVNIASGAQTTIDELGNGVILLGLVR